MVAANRLETPSRKKREKEENLLVLETFATEGEDSREKEVKREENEGIQGGGEREGKKKNLPSKVKLPNFILIVVIILITVITARMTATISRSRQPPIDTIRLTIRKSRTKWPTP